MTDIKLTDKQQRFVEYYCGDAKFNATLAAKMAGYSEDSARQTAAETLSKQYIQEAIQTFMDKATESAEVTTEWVVRKLKEEAELEGEGSSQTGRISAISKLGDFTGGFDKNKNHTIHSGTLGVKEVTKMSIEELEREASND